MNFGISKQPRVPQRPLSGGDFLTIAGLVLGIALMFDIGWAFKTAIVLIAMGLVVYAAWRHSAHAVIRFPVALATLWLFSYYPWGSIWMEFHAEYPIVTWPSFITGAAFHWSLFGVVALLLVSDGRDLHLFRSRVGWSWRKILGEEVWISRKQAQEFLAQTPWGRMHEPEGSLLGLVTINRGLTQYQKEMALFGRFIRMALESFEQDNRRFVREIEGKKEYQKDKLARFAEQALDEETVAKFGAIPRQVVD